MGLENGLLQGTQITVSSSDAHSEPSLVRLNTVPSNGKTGGWLPNNTDKKHFVQVNFKTLQELTGIITQGEESSSHWVTTYEVMASNDSEEWIPVMSAYGRKIFRGNTDSHAQNMKLFQKSVIAKYIRVVPISWHDRPGLRMELLGCYEPHDPCIEYGPWLSLNVPSSDNTNEIEDIDEIIKASKLCSNPIGLECREYNTKKSYKKVEQKVSCDISHGLRCLHGDQLSGTCLNYEVRIKCFICGPPKLAEATPPPLPPVPLCPEIDISNECPTSCPAGMLCNGQHCIDPLECPCKQESKVFKPGGQIETSNCELCDCMLEGHSRCSPKVCTSCKQYEKASLLPNCSCHCEGCMPSSKLCPSNGDCIPLEKWCDGISDCLDDEKDCIQTAPTTIEEFELTTTPVPFVEKATCDIAGKHFRTFDGQEFDYDICDHIILQDVNENFNITVHKNCENLNKKSSNCVQWMTVKHDHQIIDIGPDNEVKLDGHKYSPSQLPLLNKKNHQFTIEVIGQQVVFKSLSYGFIVTYSSKSHLKVEVTPALLHNLVGLCGFYNGLPFDDRKMANGKHASTIQEFGNSWTADPNKKCVSFTCPPSFAAKAFKACNKLREPPFDQCTDAVPTESYITACLGTVCECLLRNETKTSVTDCSCDNYLPLIQECEKKLDNRLRGWRMKHGCITHCPPGLEWNDCGPSCQLTCDSLNLDPEQCAKECVPGCFCPEGMVLDGDVCKLPNQCSDSICQGFGDPHFKTFDGLFFSFQSTGSFVLASLTLNNITVFKIEAISRRCSPKATVSCVVGLNIIYHKNAVNILKGEPLQVNGELVQLEELPKDLGELKILGFPGPSIAILIPDLDTEARYYGLNGGFAVKVPSQKFSNNTSGLCGNCNGNDKDELLDQKGNAISISDYVCSFVSEDDHKNCKSSFGDVPFVEEVIPSCNGLYSDIFSACHPLIDPEMHVKACSLDAVHNKDEKGALCKSLMEYSRECCQVGEVITDWLKKFECNVSCEAGLEYHQCHDACPQTCQNIEVPLADDCNKLKIDGCFCPENKVLKNGTCVDPIKCKTCDDNGHVVGDTWSKSLCEICKCTTSFRIECVQEICPKPPICHADENLVSLSSSNNNCCKEYACSSSSIKCPPIVIPKCLPGEVSKIKKSNESCPVYECACDSALCPAIIWPSDLQPGQTTEIEKSGCCNTVKIICHPASCPETPECAPGLELKETKGECCSLYRCKPVSDVCLYHYQYQIDEGFEIALKDTSEAVKYKPNENWQDGLCRNCSCVGSPGHYIPQCTQEQCPVLQELPDDIDYVLHKLEVPWKCCPEIVRLFCKDELGHEYEPGSEWHSSIDPCVSYVCEMTPIGDVHKIRKDTICPKCPQSSEFIKPSKRLGQCCGICRPNKCEDAGSLYSIGEKWNSVTHPCYTAECIREGGNIRTIYTSPSCPSLPDNCPEKDILWDEEHCCQKCNVTTDIHCNTVPIPLNETIGFFTYFELSHGGLCINENPIPNVLECAGTCESHSYYSLDKNDFKSVCQCCKVKVWINRTVELTCRDKTKIVKPFQEPSSCECSKCAGEKEAETHSWKEKNDWNEYNPLQMQQDMIRQQEEMIRQHQEITKKQQQQQLDKLSEMTQQVHHKSDNYGTQQEPVFDNIQQQEHFNQQPYFDNIQQEEHFKQEPVFDNMQQQEHFNQQPYFDNMQQQEHFKQEPVFDNMQQHFNQQPYFDNMQQQEHFKQEPVFDNMQQHFNQQPYFDNMQQQEHFKQEPVFGNMQQPEHFKQEPLFDNMQQQEHFNQQPYFGNMQQQEHFKQEPFFDHMQQQEPVFDRMKQ